MQYDYQLLTFGLLALVFLYFTLKPSLHSRNVKKADKSLTTLKQIENPAKQFAYIRKVNPFVFEEMILTAFSKHGHKIKRNKRYTGDGGIDGQVVINNQVFLIQAKRYKNHISPSHISDFANICQKRKQKGLFIHSGKTGKLSKTRSYQNGITIISGQKLLALLTEQHFTF